MNSPPRSFARDFVEGRVDLPRPQNPALVSDQQPVVVEGSDVVEGLSDVVVVSSDVVEEPAPLEAENVVVGEQHALAGARKRIELAGSRRRINLLGSSTVRQAAR